MCLSPIRVLNQYTHEYMFVPCQKCDECLIDRSCRNIASLSNWMKDFKNGLFVTLTYDNEHIPYVQPFAPYVYRGLTHPEKIYDLGYNLPDFEQKPITGFPSSPFSGVLFYPDIQKFLKRLRINYERRYKERFEFRFCACLEYGSLSKRPHYHILFLSNEEFDGRFRNEIVRNWQMCDWDKLDVKEVIKDATNGCASYLAAYMCGYFSNDALFQIQNFKPRFIRSKDVRFSADSEIRKNIEQFQKCRGYIAKDKGIDGNPFGRCEQKQLDRVSYFVVSSGFFNTLYQCPRGFSKTSANDKFRCCLQVLRRNREKKITIDECSTDYKFCLCYKRYLLRNGFFTINQEGVKEFIDDDIHQINFVDELLRAVDMRLSLLLKLEMKESEVLPIKEYVINKKVNSWCDDLDKREYRLKNLLGSNYEFGCVSRPRSNFLDTTFAAKLKKYKRYLLPKHLNNYYGFNF